MKTNFISPLSFLLFLDPGSWIRDPGSGMGKNQDPESGINIPDPQHWFFSDLRSPNHISDSLVKFYLVKSTIILCQLAHIIFCTVKAPNVVWGLYVVIGNTKISFGPA